MESAVDERQLVLCPVRGGKRSARTVDRAVELARAAEARLAFLYVVDVDFLDHATVARVKLMADELRETGRFALSILAEKARARGVTEVAEIIREGKIGELIPGVAAELGATTLVVGQPLRTPGAVSMPSKAFQQLLRTLRDRGLDVVCVE